MTAVSFPVANRPALLFQGNRDGNYDDIKAGKADGHGSQDYSYGGRFFPDEYIMDVIKRFVRPGEPVIELGCNQGNNLLNLAAAGYQAYGVDLEPQLLEKLNRQAAGDPRLKTAHAAQWDFAENGDLPPEWEHLKGKVKALYSVHVLSHLSGDKLEESMRKLSKYLAPGGVAVVSIIDPTTPTGTRFREGISDTERLSLGYMEHDESTVRKAFQGMSLLPAYSRPFMPEESIGWTLPRKQLRWYVFQKPLNPATGRDLLKHPGRN